MDERNQKGNQKVAIFSESEKTKRVIRPLVECDQRTDFPF